MFGKWDSTDDVIAMQVINNINQDTNEIIARRHKMIELQKANEQIRKLSQQTQNPAHRSCRPDIAMSGYKAVLHLGSAAK